MNAFTDVQNKKCMLMSGNMLVDNVILAGIGLSTAAVTTMHTDSIIAEQHNAVMQYCCCTW
jgi:hypothetical protein